MPRVSVIIPTFNWSSALHFAVAAVLRQTLDDFELWVVGDGCTDESAEVVAAFADPRIHWHNFANNQGSQAYANNWALARARGEWVAYCNHDDVWKQDHLERVVAGGEAAQADFAFGLGLIYYPDDRRISGLTGEEGLRRGDTVVPSTVIHRRALYDELGGWPTPAETAGAVDAVYFARLLHAGKKFVQVPALTVFKFPATARPGSYLRRDAGEQEEITRRLLCEAHLVETELLEVLRGALDRPLGRVQAPTAPANVPVGWTTDLHRQIRGLRPDVAAMERLPAEVDEAALPWRVRSAPRSVHAGERFEIELALSNRTGVALGSRPPHPIHWSYHWYGEAGDLVSYEGTRSALLEPLAPGDEAVFAVLVDAPSEPGRYRLRPALVQEDVRWFDLVELGASSVAVEVTEA